MYQSHSRNDSVIFELKSIADQKGWTIYLCGISALTRILQFPTPNTEMVMFETKEDLNAFLNEWRSEDFLIGNYGCFYVSSIGDKKGIFFNKSDWNNMISMDIEGFAINVNNENVIKYNNDFNQDIHGDVIIKFNEDLKENPVAYWNGLRIISYLPCFKISDFDHNLFPYVSGMVEDSVLDLKSKFSNYGKSVITNTIMDVINNIYFPFSEIMKIYEVLVQIDNLGPYIQDTFDCYDNLSQNLKDIQIKDLRFTRFALLIMPLYLFSKQNDTTNIMKNLRKSSDFVDFSKFNLGFNEKLQFVLWYFIDKLGFESELVLKSANICDSLDNINYSNIGEWIFVNGLDYWKEIICLLPSNDCSNIYYDITNSVFCSFISREDVWEIIRSKSNFLSLPKKTRFHIFLELRRTKPLNNETLLKCLSQWS